MPSWAYDNDYLKEFQTFREEYIYLHQRGFFWSKFNNTIFDTNKVSPYDHPFKLIREMKQYFKKEGVNAQLYKDVPAGLNLSTFTVEKIKIILVRIKTPIDSLSQQDQQELFNRIKKSNPDMSEEGMQELLKNCFQTSTFVLWHEWYQAAHNDFRNTGHIFIRIDGMGNEIFLKDAFTSQASDGYKRTLSRNIPYLHISEAVRHPPKVVKIRPEIPKNKVSNGTPPAGSTICWVFQKFSSLIKSIGF